MPFQYSCQVLWESLSTRCHSEPDPRYPVNPSQRARWLGLTGNQGVPRNDTVSERPSQSRRSAATALPEGEPRALRAGILNFRLPTINVYGEAPPGRSFSPRGCFYENRNLRRHRAIRQDVSGRIFAPIQSLENEGILYVFQRVKKASQSLPPAGGKGILIIFCRGAPQGGLSCPFGAIHLLYLTENTTQAASVRFVRQRRTNRARSRLQSFCQKRAKPFFDSLESCMDFWFFKLKKWGKKTAETRRPNCTVLPYKISSFSFPETCPEFFPRFLSEPSASRHRHLP